MLCRGCGSEMVPVEHCQTCSEAVLWKCPTCNKENDRSIHTYHPVSAAIIGCFVWLLHVVW